MNPYPRGSEWRKWDLHLHAPGTKMSDNYSLKDGELDLEQFCRVIHDSDVAVVGIADYFSLDSFFAVREKYQEIYPHAETLILPNLELRLPVSVNRDAQEVNLHLIFRPTLTRDEATKFVGRLKTAATTGSNRTSVTCADLRTADDFASATVSVDAINDAIKETFGEHATVPALRQEHVIVVASAKGDGIRPGGAGIQRKKLLTDEIDKFSDAFFANAGSREHFLATDRLETKDSIAPKPVFDGCDAHSFEALLAGLGKQVTTEGRQRNITWIKADPSYAGLLQTLIEPGDRVAMQLVEPDLKEPYKVISKVRFSNTDAFPSEIVLNHNLNAIIGSRSSGKSALLAFIAHAIDPAETVRLQVEAAGLRDSKDAGPAAGYSWSDVENVTCDVDWASGEKTLGKIIYIPQNSLHKLSQHPEEITKKIAPALFRTYPAVKVAYDGAMGKIAAANTEIKTAIDEWFNLADRIDERTQEIKEMGDNSAIQAERDRLQAEIEHITTAANLTELEVTAYQQVAEQLDAKESRLKDIAIEVNQLSSYVLSGDDAEEPGILPGAVQASVTVRPSNAEVPESVGAQVQALIADTTKQLEAKIEEALVGAAISLAAEQNSIRAEIQTMKTANADLIARQEANQELTGVVADHQKQVASLEEITRRQASRGKLIADQTVAASKIVAAISARDSALTALETTFKEDERVFTDLKFEIESAVPSGIVEHASIAFNQRSTNAYIKNKGDFVAYEDAQADPTTFLSDLRKGIVTLNKGYEPSSVAADVLTVTKEVRFAAELDKDRIGGFRRSSMTPGKQALFALTLILNESQEPWPLLIDQPEDDLDSRSIYDTIVPYLTTRKKERQIIMVSHNANLVIGADAEQVIVANRHGDDRKNKDARTFEYFTGSLEHSQSLNENSATILGRFGIREHACEILDGGEEAFRKRREKYKIQVGR